MKIRAAILEEMGRQPPYAASQPLTIDEVELAPPGLHCNEGQAFEPIDEKILENGYFGGLAADADLGAALALGRLFALITKHHFALFIEDEGLGVNPFEFRSVSVAAL